MKGNLKFSALAAAVVFSCGSMPLHAQTSAPAKPAGQTAKQAAKPAPKATGQGAKKTAAKKPAAKKAPSEFERMIVGAATELSMIDTDQHLVAQLEQIAKFQFTPSTRALLQKYLGTDQILQVVRNTAPDGSYDVDLATPEIRHASGSTSVHITPFKGKLLTDQPGTRAKLQMFPAEMTVTDTTKNMRMEVRGIRGDADMQKFGYGFWTGTGNFDIASIAVGPVRLENIRASMTNRAEGTMGHMDMSMVLQRVLMGGEDFGSLRMKMRFADLDLPAFKALETKNREELLAAKNNPAKLKALQEQQGMAALKLMVQSGMKLHLDEISVTHGGATALVNGVVAFKPVSRGQDESFDAMFKSADIRFELRVPKAFIEAVSKTMVRTNLRNAQPGQPVSEDQVAQGALTMNDVMVGKMINAGATLQDDVLVMTMAIENGELMLNGRKTPLPTQNAGAPAANGKAK